MNGFTLEGVYVCKCLESKFCEKFESGDMKQNILLISPMPGPPNTLISSLDDPPLSLIGMM